jgi:hypothetical protein
MTRAEATIARKTEERDNEKDRESELVVSCTGLGKSQHPRNSLEDDVALHERNLTRGKCSAS